MSSELTPHPQADILRAIADGVPVQFLPPNSRLWIDLPPSAFFDMNFSGASWRIKPKPKVKAWRWMFLSNDGTGTVRVTQAHYTEERVVTAMSDYMVLNRVESTMKEIAE